MQAERNPDYLRAVQRTVLDFKGALTEFLELYVVNDSLVGRGMMPAVLPRDGADSDEIARRHSTVAQAAGRAAAAPGLTNVVILVQGAGPIDPIAAWSTMTKPKPLLEADDVLGACDQMIGRLDGLILKAEAEAPPTIGAEAMHPLIWGAAEPLWRDRHYRHAVTAAAEALIAQIKARTGRNDVAETSLWQEVFSDKDPLPGKPRLRWPGDPSDRNVKNMNDGLRQFAPGVQMTIRNTAAHSADEFGEQAALERLAALSLLARWAAGCDVHEAGRQ